MGVRRHAGLVGEVHLPHLDVRDVLEHLLGRLSHHHFLARRPDVEPGVVAELTADVKEVVVGVDEEVRPAPALDVVEGGDRGRDEGARPDGAARPAQHEAQAVVLGEALEQLLQLGTPATHFDREHRTAELPR